MYMNKLILIYLFPLFLMCCRQNTFIDKIYENRDDLLQTFKDIEVTERGDIMYFMIHSDTLVNNYILTNNNNSYSFVISKTEFELTDIYRFDSSEKYSVQNYLSLCIKKMQDYNIKGVSSNFCHIGVTTVFYLRDALVMYIPDKDTITNGSWINCLRRSNKLDECWYWISLDDYKEIFN